MSRKFWVVMPTEGMPLDELIGRRYIPHSTDMRNFGIFFNRDFAVSFAKEVAVRSPGVDIQIAEATEGFYAPPPLKITQKTWNTDGEYLVK